MKAKLARPFQSLLLLCLIVNRSGAHAQGGDGYASATELLVAFSGEDAKKYEPFFRYSPQGKIVDIELHAVGTDGMTARYTDEPKPWEWVNNILRIKTADGYEAISGVATYHDTGYSDDHLQLMKTVVEDLKNLKTLDPVEVREIMTEKHPDLTDEALSSIDIALWDLAARKANLPFHKFFGSKRSSIKSYASIPFYDTVAEHLEAVDEYAKRGYGAFKFHVWGRVEEDAKLVRAVNEKYAGTRYRFMGDHESAYNFEDAMTLGKMMDDELFIWFEAPISDMLFDQYRALKDELEMSLVPTGYQYYSADFMREGIKKKAWDAGRFDVTVVGGYTKALELMIIAEEAELPIEIQSWGPTLSQAANLHLMLANDRTAFFEQPTPKEAFEFGMINGNMFRAGKNVAPGGPGLGIEVDWDILSTADFYRFSNDVSR